MNSENFSLKKELREAISRGLDADSVSRFLLPLIKARKDSLWKTLCNNSPDYQKIDNSYYFGLHLECKMLTDMENEITEAITRGEEASERLAEAERVQSVRSVGSNLRM